MATTEELALIIRANSTEAQRALDAVNKQLDDMIKKKPQQNDFLGDLKKNWQLVAGGALAAYAALKTTIDFMAQSIQGAAAQEKVLNGMATAMQKVGIYSQEAFDKNVAFAESLSKVAGIADDDIEKMQTLFITFGASGDQLNKLSAATVDFAAATGKDLTSAADMVARAFQNDNENIGRYKLGIEGASGSSERLTSIAKQMTAYFGGRAAADMETFEGKLRRIKVANEELQETFGTAMMNSLKPTLDQMAKFATSAEAIKTAEIAGKGVVVIFELIRLVLNNLLAPFKAIGAVTHAAFTLMKESATMVVGAFEALKKGNLEAAKSIVLENDVIKKSLKTLGEDVKGIGIDTFNSYKGVGAALVNVFKETDKAVQTTVENTAKVVEDTAKVNAEALEEFEKKKNEIILRNHKEFNDEYMAEYKATQEKKKKAQEQEKEDTKRIQQEIFDTVVNIQKSIFAEISSARQQALDEQLAQLGEARSADITDMEARRDAELSMEGLTEEEKTAINDKYKAIRAESDRKYAAQEKQLKSKKWEEDKGWAIAQSLIDTAVAVTKALSSSPPPLNFVLAGISGAAGLVQTGLIASRSNPFNAADGGEINEPVHGVGASGRQYTFGENQSEVVSPTNNYGGASIVIQNMTISSKNSADDFIFQLEKRTGARLLRR